MRRDGENLQEAERRSCNESHGTRDTILRNYGSRERKTCVRVWIPKSQEFLVTPMNMNTVFSKQRIVRVFVNRHVPTTDPLNIYIVEEGNADN